MCIFRCPKKIMKKTLKIFLSNYNFFLKNSYKNHLKILELIWQKHKGLLYVKWKKLYSLGHLKMDIGSSFWKISAHFGMHPFWRWRILKSLAPFWDNFATDSLLQLVLWLQHNFGLLWNMLPPMSRTMHPLSKTSPRLWVCDQTHSRLNGA